MTRQVVYEWFKGGLRRFEILGPDTPPIPSASAKRKRFNDAVDNAKKLFRKKK
jgi:hypothetical protein